MQPLSTLPGRGFLELRGGVGHLVALLDHHLAHHGLGPCHWGFGFSTCDSDGDFLILFLLRNRWGGEKIPLSDTNRGINGNRMVNHGNIEVNHGTC